MSVLEELKSSARDSLDAKGSELERLLAETWTKKESNEAQIRETLLAFLSEVRTVYEVTVGQARETESVVSAAFLWYDTRFFYVGKLSLWEKLKANWRNGAENDLFLFIANSLAQLEKTALEQYEFYASLISQSESRRASNVQLSAVFEPCEEGGFHAFVPEIAGVHSQGETLKEAAKNLTDALGLFLLDELEDKLPNVDPTNRIEIKLSFSPSQSETARA